MNTIRRQLPTLLILSGIWWFSISPASAQLLGAIGGIEGVGEEWNSTPLITMTGEANLDEGAGVVGIQYVHARITRLFGEKIENASEEFPALAAKDTARALEITRRSLLLGYGITSRLNIVTEVQWDQIRNRLAPPADETLSGMGNVNLLTKYQVSSDPALAVRLTVVFPSGYEVGSDFLKLGLDVAYSASLDRASIHIQTGYLWTDADRRDQAQLDEIVANLALTHTFGESFMAVIELNYRLRVGDDGLEDVLYVDPPDQMALDLSPGFKIRVKDNLIFASAVRIALLNDIAFGYDTQYLFLLGYSF